ncbi:helix-turn-helix transcriptional regulator [Robertmurraya sp. FSL W8-0741]|uniref:helix-turn-helix domain-containing protein n=1 Tax=Robertmurraya sp. FSL W8-0741 TaxID=2954629 RepID=UPI0030F92035
MGIPALLRKVRKLSGLSQEELGEKLYMPRTTISKVENGKMDLKFQDALRWFTTTQTPEALAALLCGVDVNTLIQNISMLVGGFIKWF